MVVGLPKVTCITPTANRAEFLPRCIELFKAQDYKGQKELCIADSNMQECLMDNDNNIWHWESKRATLGDKRNELSYLAKGDIIICWDDDDYYAPDFITRSVNALIQSNAQIVGLNTGWFYLPHTHLWKYSTGKGNQYVLGATMCYWRKVWEQRPYPKVDCGEDSAFQSNRVVRVHDYIDGFIAIRHGKNTSGHKMLTHLPQYDPAYAKHLMGDFYEKF